MGGRIPKQKKPCELHFESLSDKKVCSAGIGLKNRILLVAGQSPIFIHFLVAVSLLLFHIAKKTVFGSVKHHFHSLCLWVVASIANCCMIFRGSITLKKCWFSSLPVR